MTTETTRGIKKVNRPSVESDKKATDHPSLETRLIALNAAFEAARAAQAGVEFALLVDETLNMEGKAKGKDARIHQPFTCCNPGLH